MLLRCNNFAGIQKAVVDQTGSRQQNDDHELFFFWCKFGLGSALELLFGPITKLVVGYCHIKSTFRPMSQLGYQEMIFCCCLE